MIVLKWLGYLILFLVVLVGALFVYARFHDGPITMIPGGPLKSGELVTEPVTDWTFAENIPEIEMQLVDDSSSRTTWILVRNGVAYIPASLSFPPGKSWHKRADKHGAAVIRVQGKRYPIDMRRISDEQAITDLKGIVVKKYGAATPGEAGGVWFFELSSRPSAES